jgi:hypothetical protein
VDERSCHVEDDECPNPREEQNQREGKKYKPHEQTPLMACHNITLRRVHMLARPQGHIPIRGFSGLGLLIEVRMLA